MTDSERARVPAPIIRKRLPSGRGSMEQPNVTGDGPAALTPKFWVMVVLTGVATGLFGDALMYLLFSVQHLAFGYHTGELQAAVRNTPHLRRVLVPLIGGVVGGPAWYLLRRYTKGKSADIDDEIWNGEGNLSFRRSAGTSVISELVIGMGASIGRESAPKLMGGVSGTLLSRWFHLEPAQQRLLVACGAGAGLAAVYNVPLGGAAFTAEIMLGSITLPIVLPALVCSSVATFTAWIYLPDHATYVNIPPYKLTATLIVAPLVIGPAIGLISSAWVRLIGFVSFHRLSGVKSILAPALAFGILGLIGIAYPELFGNGKDMAHSAFLGEFSVGLLAALFILKPIVTSLCLGTGAQGGLFTPTLSTGAVLGGFLGVVWSHIWPGSPVGAYALIGAAAMIGASMQAPVTGLILVLELTQSGYALMVPMIGATAAATLVTRIIDGYSIYSARLAPKYAHEPERAADPPAGAVPAEPADGAEPDERAEPTDGTEPTAEAEPTAGAEPPAGAEPAAGAEPSDGVEPGVPAESPAEPSPATPENPRFPGGPGDS